MKNFRQVHSGGICFMMMLFMTTTAIPTRAENSSTSLKRFQYSQPQMGVKFTITLYASDESTANKAAKAAFLQIKTLNNIMSDYDPKSEISKLSQASPTKKPIKVSEHLWKVLQHGQALSIKTNGAFDMTIGPYSKLWRTARKNRKLPTADLLKTTAKAVGYRKLVLYEKQQTVELRQANMQLDLGGIAKGYAADKALRILRKHGIRSALINASGDMVMSDKPPDKKGWTIAVASIKKNSEPSRYLQLSNCAVATSGDLYQHVVIGKERYSHIINPHTGIGLTTRSSVTVIAPNAITADSLASAISVLGPNKSLKLAQQLCKVELLILQANKKKPQEYYSPGFRKFLLKLDKD